MMLSDNVTKGRAALADGTEIARVGVEAVAAEIVHSGVGLRDRGRHPLDIGPEALSVDRPLDQPGSLDAIAGQAGIAGQGWIARNQPETFAARYVAGTPLGRMANEDDMIGAVAYLAGDLSAYVTGQNLVVDGGWTAW